MFLLPCVTILLSQELETHVNVYHIFLTQVNLSKTKLIFLLSHAYSSFSFLLIGTIHPLTQIRDLPPLRNLLPSASTY